MKKIKKLCIILLFLILSTATYALVLEGTDIAGNSYTSDSAQGSIVEKTVLSSDNTQNSSIFSWGGPIANATNAPDLSVSDVEVSDVDIYVVTIGADITDAVATSVPVETPTETTTPSSSSSIAGGGGGGSSKRDTYGLISGDVVTVIIDGEPHTIAITNILADSAVLTIDNKYIIEMGLTEEKKVDLNGDGVNDISITLDNVSDLSKITITVADLTEEIPPEETTESLIAEPLERITAAVSAIDTENVEEFEKRVTETTKIISMYVVGINLLLVIILGSMYSVNRIRKQRIYAVFHTPSPEELVKQQLSKVQQYVGDVMETGRSVASIKQELLSVGWQEYEIDTIMVDAMLKEQENLNRIL